MELQRFNGFETQPRICRALCAISPYQMCDVFLATSPEPAAVPCFSALSKDYRHDGGFALDPYTPLPKNRAP